MRIKIQRETPDKLQRKTWSFVTSERPDRLVFTLDFFCDEKRESTRARYRDEFYYNRVSGHGIKEEDVPIPSDVIAEVGAQAMQSIVVRRSKDLA